MFWRTVIGGLAVLLHWQVWAALLFFAAAQIGWLYAMALLMGKSDTGVRQSAGCLTHLIGGTVFNSFILGAVIFFLTPIMLGGNESMPLQYFMIYGWEIAKACLVGLVVTVIISVFPLTGFINGVPGATEFIQSVIIFRVFSAGLIESALEEKGISTTDIYPGFWYCVGYFIIAMLFVYACIVIFALLDAKVATGRFDGDSPWIAYIGTPLMNLLCILPLFMYANYVAIQVRHLLN